MGAILCSVDPYKERTYVGDPHNKPIHGYDSILYFT